MSGTCEKKRAVGFALTASYCTFAKIFRVLPDICDEYDVYPILSFNASSVDSRFFSARETCETIKRITGRDCITTLAGAEPIGPKALLDLLVIAPCTGNTLGKLASGITDTPVTMAYKAHMRNSKPVLIAVSTNDGLSANAANIGKLLNTKNVFFVPFFQDDPTIKPFSLTADLSLLLPACAAALEARQLQPIILPPQA